MTDQPMRLKRMDARLLAALSIAWVTLAAASATTRQPPAAESLWILTAFIPAGAALALLRHRTVYALRSYLLAVIAIGAFRSLAYLRIDAWSPAAVWMIVILTTLLAYHRIRLDT